MLIGMTNANKHSYSSYNISSQTVNGSNSKTEGVLRKMDGIDGG
jgi:hypothetical protein